MNKLELITSGRYFAKPFWLRIIPERILPTIYSDVYCCILNHLSDNDEEAHPKQELIAFECGISIQSVERAIKRLKKIKLIEIRQIKHENYYTLIAPKELTEFENYVYNIKKDVKRNQWDFVLNNCDIQKRQFEAIEKWTTKPSSETGSHNSSQTLVREGLNPRQRGVKPSSERGQSIVREGSTQMDEVTSPKTPLKLPVEHPATIEDKIQIFIEDSKDMIKEHHIKETSMKNQPTQHDKELNELLNIGLKKQGIEIKDVSKWIMIWRKEFKINLNKEHINLILNATRNNDNIKISTDLFKKVKTSSENIFPVWKTLIEGQKALAQENDIHPLAIKFLEDWTKAGLNHYKPENKIKVARNITPSIKIMSKEHESLEAVLDLAIEMRQDNFWPTQLEKQGPEFLFQRPFGQRDIFNIDKLNNGDFKTFKNRNEAPAVMKPGEKSTFFDSIGKKL